MSRLLLDSGLAMTKQAISEIVHRTMLRIVAYGRHSRRRRSNKR